MAPQKKSGFQWNFQGEPEADSVLETIPSYQGNVPLRKRAGQYLVELSSLIRQLREAFLSSEQRARLAGQLRDTFLAFQRLSTRSRDADTYSALTQYLALVGSLGVIPFPQGEEPGEVFTLLEAMATGSIIAWAHHFYSASRAIKERDIEGRIILYALTTDILEAEREARRNLMHQLLREEV